MEKEKKKAEKEEREVQKKIAQKREKVQIKGSINLFLSSLVAM